MTTRKLDKQDLEELKTLQESYQHVTSKIANSSIEESLLSDQLNIVTNEKEIYLEKFKTLQQKESKLIETLKDKYGDGEINIEHGTFNPAETVSN